MSEGLRYILDLARKNTEEIGFLPAPKVEAYLRRGQVLTERENDELCGFLVFGSGWPDLRVYQSCIQYDARRVAHGVRLVGRLESIASQRGYESISLWCAAELEANEFWAACGFEVLGRKAGGARRGRELIRWRKALHTPLQPRLREEE